MPFTDKQIIKWAKDGGIDPFIPRAVNPASIDLHLGRHFYNFYSKERKLHELSRTTLWPNTISTQLWNLFMPKKKLVIMLAMTLEHIYIPNNVAASVKLKTTPTRKGLGQIIGDWVDPGFNGKLTLMLHAHSPVDLRYAQPVCQLVLYELGEAVALPYSKTGHYNGITFPTFAYDEVQ